ncbi:MAG: uracil-DNA glycosylase family protein [Rhizobiaceae bacterium]
MTLSQETRVKKLSRDIGACRICLDDPKGKPLPHEPRPVAVLSSTAKLAICGQAPGTRVHASGVPFTDPSGDRLRDWMGIGKDIFYDPARLSIIPMGFCFPGLDAKGGDLPPRRECAGKWHSDVFEAMPQIELILAVGMYAQKWHLGNLAQRTLSDTVADWRSILANTGNPAIFPLPHPSWRNNSWIAKRPWFTSELLPELRKRVSDFV